MVLLGHHHLRQMDTSLYASDHLEVRSPYQLTVL